MAFLLNGFPDRRRPMLVDVEILVRLRPVMSVLAGHRLRGGRGLVIPYPAARFGYTGRLSGHRLSGAYPVGHMDGTTGVWGCGITGDTDGESGVSNWANCGGMPVVSAKRPAAGASPARRQGEGADARHKWWRFVRRMGRLRRAGG